MIHNKLKELLCELTSFKVSSDIDEAFKSMHQSIMTKNEKLCLWRLDCLTCNDKT